MKDHLSETTISKFSVPLLFAATLALLVGCSDNTDSLGGSVDITPAQGSLTLVLTNPVGGATVTSVTVGGTITVKATLKDAAGAVVVQEVVTFATDPAYGTLDPALGSALTDAAGVAVIDLVGVAAGASTITGDALAGGVAVTGSIGYAVVP